MPSPDGKLTPAQFEIMELLWDTEAGLTVAEIWDAIRAGRNVGRTTILNLVDRLEKRGWLKRRKDDGVFRYRTAVERRATEDQLAADFASEFFGGSAADLVMSLIGSKRVSKADIQRLKQLLDDKSSSSIQRKGG